MHNVLTKLVRDDVGYFFPLWELICQAARYRRTAKKTHNSTNESGTGVYRINLLHKKERNMWNRKSEEDLSRI